MSQPFSRTQKFWTEFLSNSEALQKAQMFPMLLWQGISEGDYRRQIWTKYGGGVAPPKAPSSLPRHLREQLWASASAELDLGSKSTLPTAESSAIQRIVLEHADRHALTEYQQGLAHLVAILLSVTQSEQSAASLLEHLFHRLEPYREADGKRVRTDALVLADILFQELPQLCAHFNQCGLDVNDLHDIVSTWLLSCFASFFPVMAVVRLIDILLFDAPENLIGFVFGVFKVYAPTLMQIDISDLFRKITEMPRKMSDRQVFDALKYGYETVRNNTQHAADLRLEKDWARTTSVPGPVRFCKGIGSPLPERPEAEAGAAADASEQKVEEIDSPVPMAAQMSREEKQAQQQKGDEILGRLDKYKNSTLDQNLRKILEDTQRELRRQYENVATLKSELKGVSRRPDRGGDDLSVGSSVESSVSSLGSNTDVPTAESGDGTDQDPQKHRRSLKTEPPTNKGCVPYSKLFQHQQFPCLYMEGYLLKARKPGGLFKRHNSTGIFGNLHRRFFVLQGSFLTYFKSHRNSKPPKDLSVDMRGRTITRIDKHKFGKFGFEISELGSDVCLYLLFASNAEERNVWVQVLNAAAES